MDACASWLEPAVELSFSKEQYKTFAMCILLLLFLLCFKMQILLYAVSSQVGLNNIWMAAKHGLQTKNENICIYGPL